MKSALLAGAAWIALASTNALAADVAKPAPLPVRVPVVVSTACAIRSMSSFTYIGNDCGNAWRLIDNSPLSHATGITLDGWLNGGIMGNADNPPTRFNGPVGYTDKDNGQFNQAYVSLGRAPPKDNRGLFVGGRVDALYGSDFFFNTAAGLDGSTIGNIPKWANRGLTYGTAIPQAYVEVDYNDLSVKAGHFYTIIGHELAMAKYNFFASHSYAFLYGEPGTSSGVLVSKPLGNWTVTAGAVGGWNQFAAASGDKNFNNFLGGISYAGAAFGAALNVQTGNESDINVAGVGPFSNRTLVNFVATADLSPRVNVLLEALYGTQQATLGFNALNSARASWYGVNTELIVALNDKWSAGGRLEWFDDPQGYLVTGLRPGNIDARFRFPGSFYAASVGLNFKPNANVTLRGEVRYDWYQGVGGFTSPGVLTVPPSQPYDDAAKKNQLLFGLDAILQF